jgi:DNA polymerase-3 subunit epsilon
MKPLAVVDVETTGLNPYRHDRVVEVAVVLVVPGQGVSSEVATLVNPERDVGPTSIHGITASDIINAPRFADIACHLTDALRVAVGIVGYNVRFDISFLRSEYKRIGVEMPRYTTIDTMALAGGGGLANCCEEYGVKFTGRAHCALHDARATASLMEKCLLQTPNLLDQYSLCETPAWPIFLKSVGRLFPRERLESAPSAVPSYIQRLAKCLPFGCANSSQPEGERDYRILLGRVLEDGRIDESEGDSLLDIATHWGLSFDHVKAIHLDFLSQLAKAALEDRYISDAERREIQSVAQLLGFGRFSDEQIHRVLHSSEDDIRSNVNITPVEEWTGKTVCFTGECSCSMRGQLITREMAEQLAVDKGLRILPSVTKKLDILVVADANTQSGKARKARQYGIRILHEPVFWRSLRVPID